ncbi:hypothetical protein SpCBS45565_g04151 [Spizellomyces sp. 'palustris']|nr:hypothetical protein SpCBS45565_g04151 [Spizellomyces sp. 'palustris']
MLYQNSYNQQPPTQGPLVTSAYLAPTLVPQSSQSSQLIPTAATLLPSSQRSYPPSRPRSPSPSGPRNELRSRSRSRSPSHLETPQAAFGSRRSSMASLHDSNLRIQIPTSPEPAESVSLPATVTIQVPQSPVSPVLLTSKWSTSPTLQQSPVSFPATVSVQLPNHGIDAPRSAEAASVYSQQQWGADDIDNETVLPASVRGGPSGLQVALAPEASAQLLLADPFAPLSNADAAENVQALRNALKGVDGHGVDTKTIINILGTRTPDQCTQIAQAYKASYGKSLADDLKSHLSGNFGKLCVGLATPLPEYDAECLREAVTGVGTNEDVLIEILIGRSNAELAAIKEAYFDLYMKKLEDVISNETSSHLKKLLIAVLQAARDETEQMYDVEADVEALFQESRKSRWSTDPSVFIATLCGRSDAHLLALFEIYQRKHGMPIESLIRKHSGGDLGKGLIALVHSIQNRPAHVATLFESSLHGLFGIHDSTLIRLTVRHRDPRVMRLVRNAYEAVFGQSLYRRVEDVTSGDYKRLLLRCVGLDEAI